MCENAIEKMVAYLDKKIQLLAYVESKQGVVLLN